MRCKGCKKIERIHSELGVGCVKGVLGSWPGRKGREGGELRLLGPLLMSLKRK